MIHLVREPSISDLPSTEQAVTEAATDPSELCQKSAAEYRGSMQQSVIVDFTQSEVNQPVSSDVHFADLLSRLTAVPIRTEFKTYK